MNQLNNKSRFDQNIFYLIPQHIFTKFILFEIIRSFQFAEGTIKNDCLGARAASENQKKNEINGESKET